MIFGYHCLRHSILTLLLLCAVGGIASAQGLLSVYNVDGLTQQLAGGESLSLVAPNGGEKFLAGDTTTIRWRGVDSADFVRLEYSLDSGATWQKIVDRTNGLEYLWVVPQQSSRQCLVRITQSDIDTTPLILSRPPGSRDGLNEWNEWIADVVRFSTDGKSVLTSDCLTTIRVWDALTGKMLDSLPVYDGSWIFSMDISRDGEWFVLGRMYGAEVRDMSGRLIGSFAHNELVENVEFSNDGKWLAVTILGQYYASNEVRMYDVQSWKILWQDRRYDPDALPEYWSVRFSPDDSHIIVADKSGAARVFNARTGERRSTYYDAAGVLTASFSPDGQRGIVGNGNGYVVIFDVATGLAIDSIRVAAEGVPVDVAMFTPDGDHILSIPMWSEAAGLWEVNSDRLVRTFLPDVGRGSADFSPDGMSVAMGGVYVGSIWNLETAQQDFSDSVWSVAAPKPDDLEPDVPEPDNPEPDNPEPDDLISLKAGSANSADGIVAFEYEATGSGRTLLYITDIRGCRLATLVDDVILPGRHMVQWNAAEQASSIFFCVLQTSAKRLIKPILVRR